MQIAAITDIHGNWPALRTALNEIRRLGADRIVCLGDTVDPLPSSRRVFEFLLKSGIPVLRGNHEDYIIAAHENPAHPLNLAPQFLPIKLVARSFESHHVEAMKALPLSLTVDDVFFCHASPQINNRGWRDGVSDELALELAAVQAGTIVCGHWHQPTTEKWRDKTLIIAGSLGLPLAGKTEAEFLMLEKREGEWVSEHRTLAYPAEEAVEEYEKSGWFREGGPMAQLLYIELSLGKRTLSYFWKWTREAHVPLVTLEDWQKAVRTFLTERGDWHLVAP